LRRFPFIALALLAVVMVRCSLGDSGASQKKQKAPEGTFELPNGRSLYMECRGSGSPTIVVEAGEATPGNYMSDFQKIVARQSMTCAYDRANIGASDSAPTPRSASDVVNDLHQLLETADVPGPYVLVGQSAGGFFVQLYGRRYPDEAVGVVAMNPVPPADEALKSELPVLNQEEREEERAYFREDSEGISWFASTKELKNAPPPPPMPFEMLVSTEAECDGDSFCLNTHEGYEEIEREVA
jgi:pimeloyl-ACP methyl ester carboxylesterase